MIKLDEVTLFFKGKKIFNKINFSLNQYDKILLRMPSGAGKSTLLKVIMGYIPIDSGKITINGLVLNSNDISKIRDDIAYISQNISFSEDSVEEYIDLIFSFKKNKSIHYSKEKLFDLFDTFKLEKSILKKSPKSLSGGEKQRIAIVLVLLLDKKILLLDEITSGLDHDLKIKVIEVIKDLDKTVIISSHDNQWLNYNEFKVMGW